MFGVFCEVFCPAPMSCLELGTWGFKEHSLHAAPQTKTCVYEENRPIVLFPFKWRNVRCMYFLFGGM